MQNPTSKFRRSSIILEKPGYLYEQLITTVESNIFGWDFTDVFYVTLSTKECLGFSFFYLDLDLLIKCKKPGVYQCGETVFVCLFFFFLIFANNSRSKQDKKKSRTTFCRRW